GNAPPRTYRSPPARTGVRVASTSVRRAVFSKGERIGGSAVRLVSHRFGHAPLGVRARLAGCHARFSLRGGVRAALPLGYAPVVCERVGAFSGADAPRRRRAGQDARARALRWTIAAAPLRPRR